MSGKSVKRGNQRLTKKPENWEFITDKTIERLRKAAPVNRIMWDTGEGLDRGKRVYAVRGFGVRITEAGSITFVLNYHNDGKERRYTIGRHPEEYTPLTAREKAKSLLADIAEGHDPLEERQLLKEEPTFAELADAYLKDAKTRKRESSLYDDRRMLGVNEDGTLKADEDTAQRKKRILTVLGEKRLAEIKQSDITRFHQSLRETPYQANRVLALLSSIFNYGIELDWIASNPAKGKGIKFEEAKRERWLTVEELQKFREALDKYKDQSAANVLRLLMLTGSRASEALKARWEEFDLQRGVWTKPSHHTKQKKVEHVPLSAPALKLLEDMAPENPTGPLFPGRERKGTRRVARVSLKRPWIAACRAAGLVEEYLIEGKRKGKDGKPEMLKRYRPTVRVHDLRHNFASHLASNGVSLQVVGKLLGHTQASTTMRYAHLQDAPLREAANQFGRIFEQAPKAKKRSA